MKRILYILICSMTILLFSCHGKETTSEIKKADTVAKPAPVEQAIVKPKVVPTNYSEAKTLADNLAFADNFSIFFGMLEELHYDSLLKTAGPYTLFAPDNSSIKSIESSIDNLSKPNMRKQLKELLMRHIVQGKLMNAVLTDGFKIRTMGGDELTVSRKGDTLMIGSVRITNTDLISGNGVIHVTDNLLMPLK
jgi:uncharacterized surface protein with fasciclin (FAS1) repeats